MPEVGGRICDERRLITPHAVNVRQIGIGVKPVAFHEEPTRKRS